MTGTLPLPYRVVRTADETPDTAGIVLEPSGTPLPEFCPGQFAMVYAFGAGDIPLSVSAVDGHRLTLTVRSVGAVSGALRNAAAGSTVGVRGPFGTGWDVPADGDVLIVAGGIGLAPLRPVVRRVLAARERYGQVAVLIGARGPRDLLRPGETREWQEAGARVLTTVDRPAQGWSGDVGVVTMLLDRAAVAPAGTAAFVCGPEVMIRATARELVHRSVPAERIQVSLERTMHCGTGHCGHCQLGPLLLCLAGPVVPWDRARPLLSVREL
ncbi:FAD/NAD(P)-binding protein [Actinacidiphila acididurans]|uniref:FAD/NAD(P)-binding protein n=1 Tax=Actinacidiphila acididurans TaxID=2784346 RepID=A0ABS2TX81_9ACTN|nr:FAD/NAD(P)-binding protein [Actinacidiphila acididurans]MBM9507958.1 FAD/NAD(P)-binding protein [Actinacidiphila acididurans]